MTITIEQKESEDKLTQVSMMWEKPNVYFVEATQKFAINSPLAYEIRRSRYYSISEESKAKATFNRYCKRYL